VNTSNYNSSDESEMGIVKQFSANMPYLRAMCIWPLNTGLWPFNVQITMMTGHADMQEQITNYMHVTYLLSARTVNPTEIVVTRQQLHNMQQWINLEAVFSMQSELIAM
jgi:hypothetical protein